jgi:sucrose phosphorylase
MEGFNSRLECLLHIIYDGHDYENAVRLTARLYEQWKPLSGKKVNKLSQKDTMLITYGDAISSEGEPSLRTLDRFLREMCSREITNVHLLPVFPYTSDDGFSVSDYIKISSEYGDWDDISNLSGHFGVMLDAVVNHTSKSHEWFRRCLNCEEPYDKYYIECDPKADYSSVTRPRTLPLLTEFETAKGKKWYWTTFSDDQIDLDFKSPELLCEVLNVLLNYAYHGARFIRLDAIGFIWKKLGTACMHLKETHTIVKLMRLFLDELFEGVYIITETNVPHSDNISYFGEGDEARLVYQFPLPPLTFYTIASGDCTKLSAWADGLKKTPLKEGTTYFNFLASHDGIGVRPVDGILDENEKQLLFDTVLKHGGRISYKQNADCSKSPYELNISYMDAITGPEASDDERVSRFLVSQAIMLSMQGVPGIYYHSLLGSQNWYEGLERSGINRRINREKLDFGRLEKELHDNTCVRSKVFNGYLRLLGIRSGESSFSPYAHRKY